MANLRLAGWTARVSLLVVPLFCLCLSKELPQAVESSSKESRLSPSIDLYRGAPARFRNFRGPGLNFPGIHGGFNFPTKYGVASFADGVGSALDDVAGNFDRKRLGLSLGVGQDDFEPEFSAFDSIGPAKHGPVTFDNLDDDGEELSDLDHQHVHEEKGEKSSESHQSNGEKEKSNEYKVSEEFDKGDKGERERSHAAGQYEEGAEAQKGHEHEEQRHSSREESANEEKGDHFSRQGGRRKGHKTTGYHNVYRKDEYKKDTAFYDDEHADSQHEQYSREDRRQAESEAERRRAQELDEAHEQSARSRQGFFTNGHQYGLTQGHDREEGVREQQSHGESKHSSSGQEDSSHFTHH